MSALVGLTACGVGEPTAGPLPLPSTVSTTSTTVAGPKHGSAGPYVATTTTLGRPDWLGERPLTTDASGYGIPEPTPAELDPRRVATIDTLPAPATAAFRATIAAFDGEALARSTWNERCPVTPDQLAYLTMTFWGFDGAPHQGEMVVHSSVATDIVAVFERLWDAGYPIEEMRIVTPTDLDAHPTGDSNNTTGFVCRAAVGSARFSEHAYGLAVDVNPFHNPYRRGERILPELAGAYLDRSRDEPAIIRDGDVVVQAFTDIGWYWGGNWNSLDDYHHFSHNNR